MVMERTQDVDFNRNFEPSHFWFFYFDTILTSYNLQQRRRYNTSHNTDMGKMGEEKMYKMSKNDLFFVVIKLLSFYKLTVVSKGLAILFFA